MAVIVKESITKKLNQEIAKIKDRNKKGLRAAALHVKGVSVKRTPVKFGHLRGSAYVEVDDSPRGPIATIGYTAYYAPFVHEINRNYVASGTGWKFLQSAIESEQAQVLNIIRAYAKV